MKKQKIIIYSNGLIHCSVCVDARLSKEEVEAGVNLENPSGTMHGWVIDKNKFADGGKNPRLCEKDRTRKHYLMVC